MEVRQEGHETHHYAQGSCCDYHITTVRAERIVIVEDAQQDSRGDIEAGVVTLAAIGAAGQELSTFSRRAIPGSPDDPPSPQDVRV
ncbi:hypothetical protein ABTJ74_19585, partial [Acinetobacter baumannii]